MESNSEQSTGTCRRTLRSTPFNRLLVSSIRLSTLGGWAFPVAGPSIWNNPPDNVTAAPTVSTFCQRLKPVCSLCPSLTLLYWTDRPYLTYSGLGIDVASYGTLPHRFPAIYFSVHFGTVKSLTAILCGFVSKHFLVCDSCSWSLAVVTGIFWSHFCATNYLHFGRILCPAPVAQITGDATGFLEQLLRPL